MAQPMIIITATMYKMALINIVYYAERVNKKVVCIERALMKLEAGRKLAGWCLLVQADRAPFKILANPIRGEI